MKILALNASPRKDKGTTDILLNHFIKATDAETTKHYITDLNIKGCMGCFNCWTKTPGKCIHDDDVDMIIQQYAESDLLILATPIYNGTVTHYLQKLMERFLPTALPYQVKHGEETRHPRRIQIKPPETVLIATAGFPDHQAFNNAKQLYPTSLHITLPAAQTLTTPNLRKHLQPFLDAVTEAAKQLTTTGTVDPQLTPQLQYQYSEKMRQAIRDEANTYFDSQIKE